MTVSSHSVLRLYFKVLRYFGQESLGLEVLGIGEMALISHHVPLLASNISIGEAINRTGKTSDQMLGMIIAPAGILLPR